MSIAKISNSSYIYAPNGVNENVKLAIIYDFVSPPFLAIHIVEWIRVTHKNNCKNWIEFPPSCKSFKSLFFLSIRLRNSVLNFHFNSHLQGTFRNLQLPSCYVVFFFSVRSQTFRQFKTPLSKKWNLLCLEWKIWASSFAAWKQIAMLFCVVP